MYNEIAVRPIGQAVKTEPSHGSNPGSIPGSVTKTEQSKICSVFLRQKLL